MPTPGAPRRIPSLDGLRAISITLVMLSHLIGTERFPVQNARVMLVPLGDLGALGVRIFFVISGYLITTLLLQEHARTGTISLRAFYVRRTLRIFPAFYAFALLMLVAQRWGTFHFRDGDAVHALTYTMNYHYSRSWELGHLWSLSVEEQFYLIWPALVLIAGPRYVGHIAVGMILLAPMMRVVAWLFLPSRDDVIEQAYPCVMDTIAGGSLLAVIQPRLAALPRYDRFLRSSGFVLVPIVLFAVNREYRVAFDITAALTIQVIAISMIVDRVVRHPSGRVFAILNARPLTWLGTMSYSLYLWQEPFLNHKAHSIVNVFPLNVALAFACALISHHLVEKRFLSLRDSWARRRRTAVAELHAA
jgi:peptidoglycan/LPS O-acetylase OafA/YrhL